jgi:hypothetical protein
VTVAARAGTVLAALAALALVPPGVGAQPDARAQAAEHFALAQAAERRQDWAAAIAEYEAAYRLAPHPSVLFNLGVDHEHLGRRRDAAELFRRYLVAAPDAVDREAVRARIEALRTARSPARIATTPAGATIELDGAEVGTAPLELALAAGGHRIVAAQGERRSVPRQVVVEYGEPIELALDLAERPGRLAIDADVEGAEIALDGATIGRTPLTIEVAAGDHEVRVWAPGRPPVLRAARVPPDGSTQIRVELGPAPAVDGGVGGAGRDGDGDGRDWRDGVGSALVVGGDYGGNHAGFEGVRYTFTAGWRLPGGRLQLDALVGQLGNRVGVRLGGAARVYLLTGAGRPYLRGAAFAPRDGAGAVYEAGGGLAIMARPDAVGAIEYYVELALQIRDADALPAADGDDGGRYVVPIFLGMTFRLGR